MHTCVHYNYMQTCAHYNYMHTCVHYDYMYPNDYIHMCTIIIRPHQLNFLFDIPSLITLPQKWTKTNTKLISGSSRVSYVQSGSFLASDLAAPFYPHTKALLLHQLPYQLPIMSMNLQPHVYMLQGRIRR